MVYRKKPLSKVAMKRTGAANLGGVFTGTEDDMRRLSMDAAREVLVKFNVPEQVIQPLSRWHRIAMVRKLSSEHASGGKAGTAVLSKYARGQRMSLQQLQQQAREKCQEIWEKQARSLAATEGDVKDEEELDNFALDLEKLMEEGEELQEAQGKGKGKEARGTGARRQKQLNEDLEDEAEQAALLRKFLAQDDDKTSQKKKKGVEASSAKGPAAKEGEKSKDAQEGLPSPIPNGSLASPSSGAPQPGAAEAGSLPRAKKKTTKSLKKRIISRRPDGTFASIKEIQITDPKEVRVGATQKGASRPTRRFRSWTPRRYV
eukprot:TRINITY_DN1956_c0_g2_i4.p1 TRINITY_DN1956_c0_g2~~TRINITY_DN1956_c0_g2_i4.p1  ORF type:complete len:317 (-),score=89.35 TRINITY_DN1956_c0_g2_i4:1036-1986(-)